VCARARARARVKLITFSARLGLHQFGLENASLLVDVTCSTNRRARNIITSTQVGANSIGPKMCAFRTTTAH